MSGLMDDCMIYWILFCLLYKANKCWGKNNVYNNNNGLPSWS